MKKISQKSKWELVVWLIVLAICFWVMLKISYGQPLPLPLIMTGDEKASVTLAWDPSPDSGVASYRVYIGTNAGLYVQNTNAGPSTNLTVNGLEYDVEQFFAVTAIGTNQLESDFSNEISYIPVAEDAPGSPSALTRLQNPQLTLHIEGKTGTNWVKLDSVEVIVISTQSFGTFRIRQEMKTVNAVEY